MSFADVRVDAQLGACAPFTWSVASACSSGEPGELVSLVRCHGPAMGVVTEGLVYPLRGETLRAGFEPWPFERLRRGERPGLVSSAVSCSLSGGLAAALSG